MSQNKRILSGVQPTGNLHLGNYLGAIKNFVLLQKEYECFFMLANMHAITVKHDPKILEENILDTTATFLASGIDPNNNTIFVQSAVSAHAELAWIFNCIARIGWLNRMTQFKEKAGNNKEKVSVGLFTYPILMAADILLYKATHVPVGEDQKQHLELCRDIAIKFNNDFNVNDFFVTPEPIIPENISRVMSLRNGTQKMSKSEESDLSRINLTDDADLIIKKIKKAKTDSEVIGENILLEKGTNNLKIIDFGLSNLYKPPDEKLYTACGSPCYAAPEMIAGHPYSGLKIDIWSCGVILYAMLCGYLPFEDPNTEKLYKKILDCEYSFPSDISEDGKDLIKKILNTKPEERYTL